MDFEDVGDIPLISPAARVQEQQKQPFGGVEKQQPQQQRPRPQPQDVGRDDEENAARASGGTAGRGRAPTCHPAGWKTRSPPRSGRATAANTNRPRPRPPAAPSSPRSAAASGMPPPPPPPPPPPEEDPFDDVGDIPMIPAVRSAEPAPPPPPPPPPEEDRAEERARAGAGARDRMAMEEKEEAEARTGGARVGMEEEEEEEARHRKQEEEVQQERRRQEQLEKVRARALAAEEEARRRQQQQQQLEERKKEKEKEKLAKERANAIIARAEARARAQSKAKAKAEAKAKTKAETKAEAETKATPPKGADAEAGTGQEEASRMQKRLEGTPLKEWLVEGAEGAKAWEEAGAAGDKPKKKKGRGDDDDAAARRAIAIEEVRRKKFKLGKKVLGFSKRRLKDQQQPPREDEQPPSPLAHWGESAPPTPQTPDDEAVTDDAAEGAWREGKEGSGAATMATAKAEASPADNINNASAASSSSALLADEILNVTVPSREETIVYSRYDADMTLEDDLVEIEAGADAAAAAAEAGAAVGVRGGGGRTDGAGAAGGGVGTAGGIGTHDADADLVDIEADADDVESYDVDVDIDEVMADTLQLISESGAGSSFDAAEVDELVSAPKAADEANEEGKEEEEEKRNRGAANATADEEERVRLEVERAIRKAEEARGVTPRGVTDDKEGMEGEVDERIAARGGGIGSFGGSAGAETMDDDEMDDIADAAIAAAEVAAGKEERAVGAPVAEAGARPPPDYDDDGEDGDDSGLLSGGEDEDGGIGIEDHAAAIMARMGLADTSAIEKEDSGAEVGGTEGGGERGRVEDAVGFGNDDDDNGDDKKDDGAAAAVSAAAVAIAVASTSVAGMASEADADRGTISSARADDDFSVEAAIATPATPAPRKKVIQEEEEKEKEKGEAYLDDYRPSVNEHDNGDDNDKDQGDDSNRDNTPTDDSLEAVRLSAIDDKVSPIKAVRGVGGDVVSYEADDAWEDEDEAVDEGSGEGVVDLVERFRSRDDDDGSDGGEGTSRISTVPDEQGGAAEKEKAKEKERATAAASISAGREKPLWRAVIDEASGDVYYYNRKTRETTWERPPDMIDARPPRLFGKHDAEKDSPGGGGGEEAEEYDEVENGEGHDDKEEEEEGQLGDDKASKGQGVIGTVKGRFAEAYKLIKEGDERGGSTAVEDRGKAAAHGAAADAKGQWRAVLDKTSGKTYYFHVKTKQTTWEKPSDFVETSAGGAEDEDVEGEDASVDTDAAKSTKSRDGVKTKPGLGRLLSRRTGNKGEDAEGRELPRPQQQPSATKIPTVTTSERGSAAALPSTGGGDTVKLGVGSEMNFRTGTDDIETVVSDTNADIDAVSGIEANTNAPTPNRKSASTRRVLKYLKRKTNKQHDTAHTDTDGEHDEEASTATKESHQMQMPAGKTDMSPDNQTPESDRVSSPMRERIRPRQIKLLSLRKKKLSSSSKKLDEETPARSAIDPEVADGVDQPSPSPDPAPASPRQINLISLRKKKLSSSLSKKIDQETPADDPGANGADQPSPSPSQSADASASASPAKETKKGFFSSFKSSSPASAGQSSEHSGGGDDMALEEIAEQQRARNFYAHSHDDEVAVEAVDDPPLELPNSDESVDSADAHEDESAVSEEALRAIAAKSEETNLWRAIVDHNTLNTYYYNVRTKETTWDKPEGFVEPTPEDLLKNA